MTMSQQSYELLQGFFFGNPETEMMRIAARRTAIQDYISTYQKLGLDPRKPEDRKSVKDAIEDATKGLN